MPGIFLTLPVHQSGYVAPFLTATEISDWHATRHQSMKVPVLSNKVSNKHLVCNASNNLLISTIRKIGIESVNYFPKHFPKHSFVETTAFRTALFRRNVRA